MSVEEKIRRSLAEFELAPPVPQRERVYLFISFDLVNSTAFKQLNHAWPMVLRKFYDLCVREIQTVSPDFCIWKYSGDEVLFYYLARDIAELGQYVVSIHEALIKVIRHLETVFAEQHHIKNFLSVKGTLWLAHATYLPPQPDKSALMSIEQSGTGKISNIIVPVGTTDEENERLDFLGPDIDIGFRISKFSDKSKLVISANLARLLMSHSTRRSIRLEQLKVVDLQVLKGVWNGRPYPIIWYYSDWSTIESSFYYDDPYVNNLAKKIVSKEYQNIDQLEKVYSDLNKDTEIEKIKNAINATPKKDSKLVGRAINTEKVAELHCVAICFRNDGCVLIGKRPLTKKTLPGVWEFGCGQLKMDQTVEQCLLEAYKEDFGAILTNISALPVAKYTIKGERTIPGFIYCADVSNPHDVKKHLIREKHIEVEWQDPKKLGEIDERQFVPDFKASIAAARKHRELLVKAKK